MAVSDEKKLIEIAKQQLPGNPVHIDEANAEAAFFEGRLLFDVAGHGIKLVNFLSNHPRVEASAARAAKYPGHGEIQLAPPGTGTAYILIHKTKYSERAGESADKSLAALGLK